MMLRVHSLAYPVTSLGPGRRAAVWLAGCSRRCPGCITPQLFDPQAGRAMEVKTLVTRLASLPMALEGLTVSGGDPMDQPRGLAELLRGVRARLPHWDVLVYSGFLLAELLADADQAEAAREVDVLVDGPYEREIPPVHPLAGSGNQQVHALSEAGRRMAARMREPAAAFNLAVACGGDGPGARQPQMLIGVSTPAKRRAAHDVLGLSGRVRDRDPK